MIEPLDNILKLESYQGDAGRSDVLQSVKSQSPPTLRALQNLGPSMGLQLLADKA